MKVNIIIITSHYLQDFVKDALGESSFDCDIKIMEYDNFYHAIEIYKKYEETADGFMISGKTALAAITKAVPEHKKPLVPFEASIISLYRLLLEEFLRNRELDTKRVLFDFLLPLNKNATVEDFLNNTNLPQIRKEVDNWLSEITLSEISILERQLTEAIIKLWEQHEVDFVICHYGSIIPALEQHEIPYCYSGPGKEEFLGLLDTLLSQIKLHYLQENLPAVIAVSAFADIGPHEQTPSLKDALIHITNDLALNIIFQEEEDKYYIFTTLKVIEFITDNMRRCKICSALKRQYHLTAYAGYGIGANITLAKNNAKTALKEALFSKKCFIVDAQQNLLGPLDAEKKLEIQGEISENVYTTAERCKLSTLTIQKLLSIIKMTGSNRITQQHLAEHLGVTARNASRILGNLEKGGAASIAYTQSVTSKGRPIKVYELNIKS